MAYAGIDLETAGRLDLSEVGAHAYISGPDFRILGAAVSDRYERSDTTAPDVKVWSPHLADTHANERVLIDLLGDSTVALVSANGLGFDRLAINQTALARGWPVPGDRRWVQDIAPRARAINKPGALGTLAQVLGQEAEDMVQKNKAGKALIKLFCMPQKDGSFTDPASEPEKFREFLFEYMVDDVRATIAIDRKLPSLSVHEQEFLLSLTRVNDLGIHLDRDLARAISWLADLLEEESHRTFLYLTGLAPSQTVAFRNWLAQQGVNVPGVGADVLQEALKNLDVDSAIAQAIQTKIDSPGASLKKAARIANHPEAARRGEFTYNLARSRRVVAAGIQVQNFPRGNLGKAALEPLRQAVLSRDIAQIRATGHAPAEVAKQILRGMICARPGHMLVSVDFARIEFAVLLHLAGADHLNARDPYRLLAAQLNGIAFEDVSTEQRQAAKPAVLGSGYAMSPAGYARQMGCDLHEASRVIGAWRTTFAPAVRLWNDIQDAAAAAALSGRAQTCCAGGCVRFEMRDHDLVCVLPSGEGLYYPHIQAAPGERYGRSVVDMSCMVFTKGQWLRGHVNLPMLVENVCSSIARDLMRDALVDAELVWPVVAAIHDEVISDVPQALAPQALADLINLMSRPRPWLPAFTPGAEGQITPYFKK